MLLRILILSSTLVLLFSCAEKQTSTQADSEPKAHDYALVLHGGAGYMSPDKGAEEEQAALRSFIDSLLVNAGQSLKGGAPAIDVVCEVIRTMENHPHFNAGKGAVFAANEMNELDASIMQGSDLNAGAVAGVRTIKNPILAARAVMESSRHVMMAREGAEAFAEEQGLSMVDNSYFHTASKKERLKKAKQKEAESGAVRAMPIDEKYGTVGCVALDKKGNIVAGTSTGGLTNKKYHRIGDSPVIAAGTYADNRTCGVSCTGVGEFFIRYAVAHEVSSQLMHTERTLDQISHEIINTTLQDINADGGLIALDRFGNVSMPFNTPAMIRGYINPEEHKVAIFKE